MSDRFEEFKQDPKALLEYREAYLAARRENPRTVAGLPDPDCGTPFDAEVALVMLRLFWYGPAADRFERARRATTVLREYREAYRAALRENPWQVVGLPDPDTGPFSAADGLEMLRLLRACSRAATPSGGPRS